MNNIARIDRRDFIRLGGMAGGGLAIGVYGGYDAVGQMLTANGNDTAQLNAFVQIDTMAASRSGSPKSIWARVCVRRCR